MGGFPRIEFRPGRGRGNFRNEQAAGGQQSGENTAKSDNNSPGNEGCGIHEGLKFPRDSARKELRLIYEEIAARPRTCGKSMPQANCRIRPTNVEALA
jgi:hypothetical protein